MAAHCEVRKGEYHDSVTLMRVAKFLSQQDGVTDSAVVMATEENKLILKVAGLFGPEVAKATEVDLVIGVQAASGELAAKLVRAAVQELKKKSRTGAGGPRPRSLDSALELQPAANLALISIAGRYAAAEARKALERGLHVMLFSDNIPLEAEVALKKFGASRGLLVMGPDAGTAIIGGVPLAFANHVSAGKIGIVAASGTGLQEASCLISNLGQGISQAIGTGGRDVKKEVGGIMFLHAIDSLLRDPGTEVLLLISKPPHPEVLEKILDKVRGAKKPVIATFLGSPAADPAGNVIATATLEDGALKAVCAVSGRDLREADEELAKAAIAREGRARAEAGRLSEGQKYLRGLYTGGTFVAETQVLAATRLRDLHSNAPFGSSKAASDPLRSRAHTVIDFGEDEFTLGRPHPMIDFSLRNKRILEEARDPETAVLLLDLVLGWGANRDPLPELLPVLNQARATARAAGRYLPIVISVTGTDSDPQCRSKIVKALNEAQVIVENSNAAAADLAIKIAEFAGR